MYNRYLCLCLLWTISGMDSTPRWGRFSTRDQGRGY